MFWKKKIELPAAVVVSPQPVLSVESMPYLELKALRDKVAEIMTRQFKQAREDFQRDFLDKLEAFDLTLDDLKPKKKKRTLAVKFRDPENPANTWSGLGKPKKWLQEKLEQGMTLEQYAVE